MCRHIITDHECDHTTVEEEQCDQALSSFATIFCDNYVVSKYKSHTTRCHGHLCKDDAQIRWLESANHLIVDLSDLEHDISLRREQWKHMLELSKDSGALQIQRERPRLIRLELELREMLKKRADLQKEIHTIVESAKAASRAMHHHQMQTMVTGSSLWTGQNQGDDDDAVAVAPWITSRFFRPIQQPSDVFGRAIYTPTPRHAAVTPAPRMRHEIHPSISKSSPLRTPVSNINLVPYQVPFLAATDNHQSSSQVITTPLGVPTQLRERLYGSPIVPAVSTPLSTAQSTGAARPKGINMRRTPRADTTWQDTTKYETVSSSTRRSGRLSTKRKVSYTEFSDDELHHSPSHATLSASMGQAREDPEGTSVTRTSTRGSKHRRTNRHGKDDYEDGSEWELHNETDLDWRDEEAVRTTSVDALPKKRSTRSTNPASTQSGNALSQYQRSTNPLDNPKIREALQKLQLSGHNRSTTSNPHANASISTIRGTEQPIHGTEALPPSVILPAPQAPMYHSESYYPSTPADTSKLSPQAMMHYQRIVCTESGDTNTDLRQTPLTDTIQVSQQPAFGFQGVDHGSNEPKLPGMEQSSYN